MWVLEYTKQLLGTNHELVHKSEVDPPGNHEVKGWGLLLLS